MTVCTSAIYMIVNPRHIQRWTFRVLVLGIFLSVVYDLIWLLIFNDINNDVDDGGLEKPVRIFSMLVAYLQLFFKVIQILITYIDHRGPDILEGLP